MRKLPSDLSSQVVLEPHIYTLADDPCRRAQRDDPRGLLFLMANPGAYIACPWCGRPEPLHWKWCSKP